jgi:hypothetical protein
MGELTIMMKKVAMLEKAAKEKYKGKFFKIPLSVLLNAETEKGETICKIEEVELFENSVEVTYGYEDYTTEELKNDDLDLLVEFINIPRFEENAKPLPFTWGYPTCDREADTRRTN